jgi:predicted peroxiredoxin
MMFDALKRPVRRLAVLLPLFVAMGAAAALAQQPPKQNVVVHLKHYTDNLHAVKMAVHLAYMIQTMGAEVTLLLDLEGVRLASTKEPQALVWGKGDPISKEYDAFVKAGGAVLLCPHCAEHAGITAEHLRPGARLGRDGALAKAVLAADKILDY